MSHPPAMHLQDCWNQTGVWGDASCPRLAETVHCQNCPVYTAAAARLLHGEAPADYLDEWAARLAAPRVREETARTASAFIFRLGAEWLALPGETLQEIAEPRAIHSLPHRRGRSLRGVVNVRGELLVCVSLGHLLGVDESAVPAEQGILPAGEAGGGNASRVYERLLIVATDVGRLVFQVSEVHGIERYAPGELLDVPATLALSAARFTRGVLPWRGRNVGCLDDALVFHTFNRSLG